MNYYHLKTKLITTNKDKMSNLQLTSAVGYNVKNIVCSEPKLQEVPPKDDKKKDATVNYMRISISTKYPDGTVGDLIIPTPELFSFGVGENTSKDSGQLSGHTMSLCLWNRDRQTEKYIPTEEQFEWTNTFTNIVNHLKAVLIEYHKNNMLVDNKNGFTKYRYAEDDDDADANGGYSTQVFRGLLGKLNPLYWGKGVKRAIPSKDQNGFEEKGVYDNGPTLYAKLIESKKKGKIITQFYDYNDNPIDPIKLMGVYCTTYSAVKIESIYIGGSISLQVKLYEANCKILEGGMTRLLPRQKTDGRLLLGAANDMSKPVHTPNNTDQGSLHGSDNEESAGEEPSVTTKALPKPRRRTVKQVPANK